MVSFGQSFADISLKQPSKRFNREQALNVGYGLYQNFANLVNHGGVVQVLVVDSDRNRNLFDCEEDPIRFDSAILSDFDEVKVGNCHHAVVFRFIKHLMVEFTIPESLCAS